MTFDETSLAKRVRMYAVQSRKPFLARQCAEIVCGRVHTVRNRLGELVREGVISRTVALGVTYYMPLTVPQATHYAWSANPSIAQSILSAIRETGGTMLVRIIEHTGYSRETVCVYLRALEDCGWVRHDDYYTCTAKVGGLDLGDLSRYRDGTVAPKRPRGKR